MRLTLALAALVAVTSALPSAPQPASKHALTTREDFVEDDFEIQAEPDDNAKRQAVAGTRSVDWPEVSPLGGGKHFLTSYPSIHPSYHLSTLPSNPFLDTFVFSSLR